MSNTEHEALLAILDGLTVEGDTETDEEQIARAAFIVEFRAAKIAAGLNDRNGYPLVLIVL